MSRHTPQETKAAGYFTIGWSVIIMVMYLIMASQAEAGEVYSYGIDNQGRQYHYLNGANHGEWEEQSVPVYLNIDQLPMPLNDAEFMVRYALWSWSQRTGKDFYYAGTTDRYDTAHAIVINWRTKEQFKDAGKGSAAGYVIAAHYVETGYRHHATILMRTDYWAAGKDLNCARMAFVHEIGHAVGITTHSDHNADVMFAYMPDEIFGNTCRYTLTSADVELTPYDGGDRCHVELTPDYDLFVPSVAGHQASLLHSAGQWRLGVLTLTDSECGTVTLNTNGDHD